MPKVKQLDYTDEPRIGLTHHLFRYPAKFHPRVVRKLLHLYTKAGDTVFDPFCGSGTLLVEALVTGRRPIGCDIDPVATFVSKTKSKRVDARALKSSFNSLSVLLTKQARSDWEYQKRMHKDIGVKTYAMATRDEALDIPSIPNIEHWFRRYVVIDLARIYKMILQLNAPRTHKDILRLCFASIIRGASNADPVPVSGLEVTRHMRQLDAAGRVINPYALMMRKLRQASTAFEELSTHCANKAIQARVFSADATKLSGASVGEIDCVITSPPYHNAVDYYRRHKLEMYWLSFVDSHEDRLKLVPRYIGRSRVRKDSPFVDGAPMRSKLAQKWDNKIRKVDPIRADAFRHYVVAMENAISNIASCLRPSGIAVFVLGKSKWNGAEIPTTRLFNELAGDNLEFVELFQYQLTNRYMSYTRRNGADIRAEYVTVFKRP